MGSWFAPPRKKPVLTLLDNIFWHALSGVQANVAEGSGGARSYSPALSPIVGFADADNPDFRALRRCYAPGERFYCDGWSAEVPAGWRIDFESTMFKMVWQGTSAR